MTFHYLKTLSSSALRFGATGFGFRQIGTAQPLNQLVLLFPKLFNQAAFYSYLSASHKTAFDKAFCKHAYSKGAFVYMVFISLPDEFRLKNFKTKFYVKSFRFFCNSVGSTIQMGSLYQHPHSYLSTKNKEVA